MENQAVNQTVTNAQASKAYRLRGGMMPLNQTKLASDAELTAKAQEFESVFLGEMLKHMFDQVDTNEMFGGGEGEETYKSFMVDEYAKMITKTGGIGIADHVKAEMIRMQEVALHKAAQPAMAAQ